jgi:predicted porin
VNGRGVEDLIAGILGEEQVGNKQKAVGKKEQFFHQNKNTKTKSGFVIQAAFLNEQLFQSLPSS